MAAAVRRAYLSAMPSTANARARAERLLETACELELAPGEVVQWFAIRLEPPGASGDHVS